MVQSLIERQVESAVQDAIGEKAMLAVKGVSKIASHQGGKTAIENYKILGKRTLMVAGVALVAVHVVSTAVGWYISRKSEKQRVEKIVRRVLREEGITKG